ncbi:hypothetical protein JCM8115_003224 [Rhodotorula mucilaginosa]
MEAPHNLPAHATKHVQQLHYALPNAQLVLHQDNHSADSTGRTVWLGAQVLSVYLDHLLADSRHQHRVAHNQRAIDLGSGTGLVALALANLGYDTLATDVDAIAHGVLAQNVSENADRVSRGRGRIRAAALDWFTFDRDAWRWPSSGEDDDDQDGGDARHVDLITTADTVYDPSLSEPLLRTLHGLSLLSSLSSSSGSPTPPPIYLALEARDPALIASFFQLAASSTFGFKCSRIDPSRIKKLVENEKGTLAWQDEADWEGVELWKLVLSKKELNLQKTSRRQLRQQALLSVNTATAEGGA